MTWFLLKRELVTGSLSSWVGITAELRVQGQDTERTEAELGGRGGRAKHAKDSTHPSWGDTGGTGESCGGWGKELQGQHSFQPGGRRRACVGAEGWSLASLEVLA